MDLVLLDHDNPSVEGDLTVAFTDEAFTGSKSKAVRASKYEPKVAVRDDDFDCLREWLKGHVVYGGIDVGPLIQNTFIDLFGHELIRQGRTIQRILERESPSRLIVETNPKPLYGWNLYGDGRLIPGLAPAIGSTFGSEVEVRTQRSLDSIKDQIFRRVGPSSLRSLDWLSDSVSRWSGDKPPCNSDIIVFIFSPNNLGVIVPVLEELTKEHNVTVIVQSHGFTNFKSHAFSALGSINASVTPAERYTPLESYLNEVKASRNTKLLRESTQLEPKPFFLDGIDIGDALADRQWLYESLQFPRIVRYIYTCSQIIDREEPDAVLLKNDGPLPTRTMSTVAQQKDVPSVLIQHGVESPDRRYVPISGTIAVWGTHWQDILENKGVARSKTVVTGAPQFDHLVDYQKKSQHSLQQELELGHREEELIVTLASQPFDDRIRISLLNTALKAVSDIDDVKLVLRPHPRENNELHQEAANKYENVLVKPNCDIHSLLFASDVVLALRSTVILEASLLNRPVIIMDISPKKPPLDSFSQKTGFTTIKDAHSLSEYIHKCVDSSDYQELIMANQPKFDGDFVIGADGRSASRVASLVGERSRK